MPQLQDKVAIVTGAARGLGKAYAEHLSAEGAAVVCADIADAGPVAEGIKSDGGQAIAVHLDVADMASCQAMADKAVETFGGIDVLVNNAALYGGLSGGRFDQISEDDWARTMNVNVTGIWHCCKAAIPAMKRRGGGSVINISSLAAVFGLPYAIHYTTSKGAVIGMTRGLARELGRDWIRVNAVAPSAVMTEGTREFMGDKHDKAVEVIAAGQSLRRNLQTDDLVGTIIYLASDASKFVTGQTIMVDGGTVYL